ncbi:hypothetical protein EIP91_000580 [Steccherinum ochraceum]|uniref:Cupin type-1 domain-containing protein n=1 Tax=Steccherinum ochraceum TaxID=92696 RepID=A0A4V2MWP4_9APHY|nr:hypothetical protein EIP91_000580 [Steccherinum ochraceum]
MYSTSLPLLLSLVLGFGAGVDAFSAGESITQEVADLKVAPTANDRLNLLNPDSNFVFDFNKAKTQTEGGAAGEIVRSAASNFPAVAGQGISMTIGFLGPCGLNTPHTHPRATEFNYAVDGTVSVGMLTENGARFVSNTLAPGQAMIIPQGAIHFEMNLGCEPMQFVAGFNSDDPGVLSIAQEFFGLPPAVVAASLGNLTADEVAKIESKIADNVAFGTNDCLQRCGITKTTQGTTQRVQRVAGNALPSGFSGPTPASSGATSTATSASSTSHATGTPTPGDRLAGAVEDENDAPSSSKLSTLDIALIVVVAILGLGYIAMMVAYFVRRNKQKSPSGMRGLYTRPGASFAPGGEGEKIFESSTKAAPYEEYTPEHMPYSEGGRGHSTPYDAPSGAL